MPTHLTVLLAQDDPASGSPGGLTWKLIAIGLYSLILVSIGYVATRRTHTVSDYYAGGKRMGFWAVAFSARATGESAWLLLGLTGMGAAMGVKAFWIVVGEVLGVGGAWLLMSRRFKRLTDRYDSITVPDYLDARFGGTTKLVRIVAALALLVFVPIYVSAQIHACGEASLSFLGMNYYYGAVAGFAVVLLYITTGGFVAVVWSDIFQGSLMVLGLVALPIIGIALTDTPIIETLRTTDPALLSVTGGSGWTLLSIASIIGFVAIGIGFLGSPQIFVRFISLRSEREISKGAAVALVWTLLADGGAVCVGLVGRAVLTGDLGTDGQGVLPEMVNALLPAFLAGIFIAIVLAATMSTIDSLLVVASSAAVRDLYEKTLGREPTQEQLVKLSRLMTFGLALFALAIAMAVAIFSGRQGIFWFVIFGWSGIAATFCPTMILSLFWRRLTATGAVAAMVSGFGGVPLFKFVAPRLGEVGGIDVGGVFAQLGELPPAFALSFVIGVVVSLVTKAGKAADQLDDV